MIFIKTLENNSIDFIHYMPFDPVNGMGKTEEELLQVGFLVEEIPEPEQTEGMSSMMFYTAMNGFWFDYEEIPKTPEQIQIEKVTELQTDLLNTKLAMAELVEQQQADNLNSQLALAEVIESIIGGTVA
ncbi:MAG: hypothetical protein JJE18_04510 [Eubacteriaceae bacterium]|nr:hypothetical protein [Eubacteriaceae bacterium]